MLEVARIYNEPVSSCCYIVYDSAVNNRCIVIDPGSEKNDNLYAKLAEHNIEPEYIILTHEHFDHCWGVNQLRRDFPIVKLVCNKECSERIGHEKTNMSVFYDNTKVFVIEPADVLITEENNHLEWNGNNIEFFKTPGHSSACMTIKIGDYLFTGDSYIPNIKTVTKLPNGNKELAEKSVMIIKAMLKKKELKLCAGH